MKIAIIKHEICINVAVAESIEILKSLLNDEFAIYIELEENSTHSIGSTYINGVWSDPIPPKFTRCPICSTSIIDPDIICSNCGYDISILE